MKKYFRVLAVCLILVLNLCACGGEQKLRGTWVGDGTFDMKGLVYPFEFAETVVFEEDGTATFTVKGVQTTYTWAATEDTLTLRDGEISYGFRFEVDGDTLLFKTGGDGWAEFVRW